MLKKIRLVNGLSIAYQRWNDGLNNPKVLCVHGWLDNSNSFAYLGPKLASKGYDVVAIDLMGHGFSDHYSKDSTLMYLNRQSHLRGVIDGLGWENSKSHLIGHSMGAGISMLFAGCYPELIQKLVMIDGFGPRTKQASNACKNVRSAIEKEAKYYIKQSSFKTPKLYETFESAIRMRISSTANYPGNQTISYEAAAKLVARGARLYGKDTVEELDISNTSVGPVYFSYDSREVYSPDYTYLTPEQLASFISAITAPSMIVAAENGWPSENPENDEMKKTIFKSPIRHITIPGGHHLHLDPNTAPHTFEIISSFLVE